MTTATESAGGAASLLDRIRPAAIERTVLGPTVLLVTYLIVLVIVLPNGVNRSFVMATALALVGFIVVLYLLLARARRTAPTDADAAAPAALASPEPSVRRADALLLLLPLTPILQYVLLNRDVITLVDALVVVGLLGAIAAAVVLLVPHALRRSMSVTVTMFVGLGLVFMLYNMAVLARSLSWHREGDPIVLLGLFGLFVVGGVALYRRQRLGTYSIAVIYLAITIAPLPFATGEAALTIPGSAGTGDGSGDPAAVALAAGEPSRSPDIFLLTYDGYVENGTMLQYGIDNAAQEAWLESQGFELYPGMYSVAGASIGTMGRVLGAEDPSRGTAGDSPYLDLLRSDGYETSGVFKDDYYYRGHRPAYDFYSPDPGAVYLTLMRMIVEGEFRTVAELADDWLVAKAARLALGNKLGFHETKRGVMTADSDGPTFLYTHTGPHHSQDSGRCLPDETELFEQRLVEANEEMRVDVETVLEHHPDAIVIVNGDHGPYLTQNCHNMLPSEYEPGDVTLLDVQDRFGTFLAIRWPDDLAPDDRPEIGILQDVMPAVLGSIYPDLDVDALRIPRRLAPDHRDRIAGLDIVDGRIVGGELDGMPLFPEEG